MSQFLLEFIFLFCASLYVRYCEYSGVHGADSRAEAPSHAVCSAVGTLCQPHCSLHTSRERSCHQVGAHRIMINAANRHLTAFISSLHTTFYSIFESLFEFVGSEPCMNISHCMPLLYLKLINDRRHFHTEAHLRFMLFLLYVSLLLHSFLFLY